MDRTIRIVHCLGWIARGGVERRRLSLLRQGRGASFEHVIVCQVAEGPLADEFQKLGIAIHEVGVAKGPLDLRWYFRAIQVGLKVKPHIIHGAVFEGNLLATALKLVMPFSKLVLEETSDLRGRRWRGSLLMSLLALFAARIVAVAPEVGELLRKHLFGARRKIVVIVNGVDADPPQPANAKSVIRKSLGLGESEFVICSSGRLLDEHKRFTDLLELTKRLTDSGSEVRLLIVGEGPDRNLLEDYVRNTGIQGNVVLLGHRHEARKILAAADLFMLVSAGEALPLALIEAMHAGLPCIATNVGGMPTILDSGKCGYLVQPGDIDSMEAVVHGLMSSPRTRTEVAKRARRRAQLNYSSSRYVQQVEDLWIQLAS